MKARRLESLLVPGLIVCSWVLLRVNVHQSERIANEALVRAHRQFAILARSVVGLVHPIRAELIPEGRSQSRRYPAFKIPYPVKTKMLIVRDRAHKAAPLKKTPLRPDVVQPALSPQDDPSPLFTPQREEQELLTPRQSNETARLPGSASRKSPVEVSAWLFARAGSSAAVGGGNGPTLGGSQAGIRVTAGVGNVGPIGVGLTGRVSAPLAQRAGKEASAGIALGTSSIPGVRVYLERRVPIDRGASGSWSAIVSYGHAAQSAQGKISANFYAEAGATKGKRTLPFGFARLDVKAKVAGSVRAGVEVVADAQRGARRIDLGPVITMHIADSPAVSVSVAWRQRIAGNARPESGPALTVSTSF